MKHDPLEVVARLRFPYRYLERVASILDIDMEDLMQEVRLQAIKSLNSFEKRNVEGDCLSFVAQSVYWRFARLIENHKKRVQTVSFDDIGWEPGWVVDKRRIDTTEQDIETLHPRIRAVILMRLQRYTIYEIANKLGISYGGVQNRWKVGIKQLRDIHCVVDDGRH